MAFKISTKSPDINDYTNKSTYRQAAAESINRNRDGSIDTTTLPKMLSDLDTTNHKLGK